MKTVELVLFSGANSLDIAGPLEVFSVASKLLQTKQPDQGYKVFFSGEKTGPITLESGLTVYAEQMAETNQKPDYLVIPGGSNPISFSSDPLRLNYLSRRTKQATCIVSICTGAFILAKLGLLDGKRCTTHWRYAHILAEQYPSISLYENAIYIEDGNVFTSARSMPAVTPALVNTLLSSM